MTELEWKVCSDPRPMLDQVRGNPVERLVERGQEPDDFDVGLLAKDVQCPGAVLAGTPGEQHVLYRTYHGHTTGIGFHPPSKRAEMVSVTATERRRDSEPSEQPNRMNGFPDHPVAGASLTAHPISGRRVSVSWS